MTASPIAVERPQDNWAPVDDRNMGPSDTGPSNEPTMDDRRSGQDPGNADYPRGSSVGVVSSPVKHDGSYREKQVKPNKVYVGGLPEHTRQEDLQSCFGKIGNIVNIELKVGYGFVEFDTREAAETSVAKYHEGYFMGNKIRVELSHGGGRTAKYSGDPGACFKCGQMGHWARECQNHTGGGRRGHQSGDAPLIDRIQPSKDYPPSRDPPSYREDYGPAPRYPPRDARYGYDYPPAGRDYRRPASPLRDYRDYPSAPMRPPRDYDDYKVRGPPASRYDTQRGYYSADDTSYPRGYGPPPHPSRDAYDRYDRRPPPPGDRYPYPPPNVRPRTPPGYPPRAREEYDRSLSREFPPAQEFRGRTSPTPSRYAPDYAPRPGSPELGAQRYRRRSGSPPRSSGSAPFDAAGFAGSGYPGNSGAPPSGGPSRSSGGATREFPSRNGRDAGEPVSSGYRRP